MTDISVFIPVFKESKQLPNLLNRLQEQTASKEIIVTVDEPSEAFLREMNLFTDVQFIINETRVGKANALNGSVKKSSGKVLLFLDSDIELSSDSAFLTKILEKMTNADVLDIKKKVERNSFLSKMAYYEDFTFNISSWLGSRYFRKWHAVIGAGLAL